MPLFIQQFVRKLRFQRDRERFRRELVEELAVHQALKVDELLGAGLAQRDAVAIASREMGNSTLAADETVDVRSFIVMEQFMQDVIYSLRLIRKNLVFSMVAIASLALGIGGNTAVFSMINAVLIKPLPFAEPDRLVRITNFYPKALLVHFRDYCRTMDIASVSPGTDLNVTGDGPAYRITASATSANLFAVLGAAAELGRVFEGGEDQPGRDRVAILSHDLWVSRFASDRNVVGRVVTINGIDRSIVGIMPAGFAFPSGRVQLWFPSAIDPRNQVDYWAGNFVPLIGRLRSGATLEQAQGEIKALAQNVWSMFPWPMPRRWNSDSTVISLQKDLAGDAGGRLLILLCTVGAVLVIACANVAGLLMARGAARRKELAMRAALGAGKLRIVRQLVTESLVLAGVAGLIGIALGAVALKVFTSAISTDLTTAARVSIDWNVVAFSAALSVFAGIAFGVAPALSASRVSLVQAVKTGGQRGAASVSFRSWLIAGEIALTLVLVIGAGLLIRSLYALSNVDLGFEPHNVLALKISPDSSFCSEAPRCIAFYDRLIGAARRVPGVADAALANTVPLDGEAPSIAVDVEDHPKTADFPAPMFWAGAITPDYLRLMHIPVLAGRSFATSDARDSQYVILITASTARRFWPGQNPIGRHVKSVAENRWRTIVGIVADVHQFSVDNRTPSSVSGAFYMPYAQAIGDDGKLPPVMELVVRTAARSPQTANDLRRVAIALNPNIPVSKVTSLDSMPGAAMAHVRSTAWLLLSFAGVALVLATIGIYGLVSYSVAQRGYEIALRMAIGATGGSILRMVLMRSLRVSILGTAAGLAAAYVAARALSGLLYGVSPTDPVTFLAVSALLLGISVAAALIPARHASRIDPIRVLRAE